ncbi:uncharacterized protein LOC126249282 [Schistocerca nitens]|uniref:uncharacterized protein LOC126249282 n=1 Tax=Schistocerca nitens TaxID=7011 RepID=UPI002117792A|nr:uncharacterized protein LOC126249282 [Schistocerca nitens]
MSHGIARVPRAAVAGAGLEGGRRPAPPCIAPITAARQAAAAAAARTIWRPWASQQAGSSTARGPSQRSPRVREAAAELEASRIPPPQTRTPPTASRPLAPPPLLVWSPAGDGRLSPPPRPHLRPPPPPPCSSAVPEPIDAEATVTPPSPSPMEVVAPAPHLSIRSGELEASRIPPPQPTTPPTAPPLLAPPPRAGLRSSPSPCRSSHLHRTGASSLRNVPIPGHRVPLRCRNRWTLRLPTRRRRRGP